MNYYINILLFITIYALVVIAYDVLFGHAGQFSAAHAAFYGIGAYAGSILAIHYHLNFVFTLIAAAFVAGVVGFLMARLTVRLAGDYLVVATLALQLVISNIFAGWSSLTGGYSGLAGIPAPTLFGLELASPRALLLLSLIVVGLCFVVLGHEIHSPFGRRLHAIRDDQVAAASIGKNVTRTKVQAFVAAAAFAAIPGALYAYYVSYIDPSSFGFQQYILFLAMAIIGGSGTVLGPIVGAAALTLLPEALRLLPLSSEVLGPTRLLIYGVLLLLFIELRPGGIIQPRRHRRASGAERSEPAAPVHPNGNLSEKRHDLLVVGERSPSPEPADRSHSLILEARDLSKRFGGLQAVVDLSFGLERSRITSLIGPNGAGKTTTLHMLAGFLKPDRGQILYEGKDISALRPQQVVHQGIVRSFQTIRLFNQMSVLDNVLVSFQHQHGENPVRLIAQPGVVREQEKANRERAAFFLEFLELGDLQERLPTELSYGQRKLLSIARMLATGARVLLLDEPTSGLNPLMVDKVLDTLSRLRDAGLTVCLVEHNLDAVEAVSDQVIALDRGQVLASGSPRDVLEDRGVRTVYLGA